MSALDQALLTGRREAEAIMRSTVRIWRPSGPGDFDWSTGTETPAEEVELYQGKARIKPFGRGLGSGVEAGERELVSLSYVVSCPFSAAPPEGSPVLPGTRITVLSSPDSRAAGSTLWVSDQQFNAEATAWRINAENRSSANDG